MWLQRFNFFKKICFLFLKEVFCCILNKELTFLSDKLSIRNENSL